MVWQATQDENPNSSQRVSVIETSLTTSSLPAPDSGEGTRKRLERLLTVLILVIFLAPPSVFSFRQFIETRAVLADELTFLQRLLEARPELVPADSATVDPLLDDVVSSLLHDGAAFALVDDSGTARFRQGPAIPEPAVHVTSDGPLAGQALRLTFSQSLRPRLPLMVFVVSAGLVLASLASLLLHRLVFLRWREAELERIEAGARLADIARASSDWFWETDDDQRFTLYTLPSSAFAGNRLLGARLWDVHGLSPEGGWDRFRDALTRREAVSLRFCFRDGDVLRWHELDGIPFYDAGGRFAGYRGSGCDISEEQQLKEELTRHRDRLDEMVVGKTRELSIARDRAEAANRAKSDFLANISHEIRTPMNVILGTSQLLAGSTLTEQQERWLGNIRRAGDHLLTLISDVLDYSKIEAGKLELEKRAIDLDALVAQCALLFADRAEEKGLELVVDERWAPGLVPYGDSHRISQIVINLLSNAVKFTDKGHVILRVDGEVKGNKARLCIAVSDSGMGLDAEQREQVFHAFQQGEASTTRRHGGTGLGLAIATNLARLMGGRISVDSQPGKGATFTFEATLDCDPVEERTAPTIALERVLLVGLGPQSGRRLRRQLEGLGCAVEELPAVAQAASVKALAAAAPEAVFLDEAVLADRADLAPALKAAMPEARFFCLVGTAGPQAVLPPERCAMALHKPLLRSALWRALGEAGSSAESAPTAAQIDPEVLAGTRILAVDDDALNRELLEELLSARGFTVFLAEDGQEAVDFLAGDVPIDLVLMDLQMPVLDGLGATRAIRERLQQQAPPIIAFTASATPEQRSLALDAGMVAFATKPVDIDALLQLVMQVVANRELLLQDKHGLSLAAIREALFLLEAGDPAIKRWLTAHAVRLRLALPRDGHRLEQAIADFDYLAAAAILQESFAVEAGLCDSTGPAQAGEVS